MGTTSAFKQIVGYVDRLNRDVGQLVVFIERSMRDRGFVSLSNVGKKITWYLSSSYEYPERWRLPNVARFFIQEGADKVTSCIFYLILLEVKSAFDFPTIICGRVIHPELTEAGIYSGIFSTARLKSLAYDKSQWQSFRSEKGWSIAEPAFEAPIEHVSGYILNLFDIDNAQQAHDNIIVPLTEWDDDLDLNAMLTVTNYAFPELEGKE